MHLNLCICIYNHSAVCIYIYAFVFVYLYFCIHICVFGLTITVRCAFIIEYSCLCIYVFAFIFVYLYLQLRHGVRYELPAFASIRCRSTPWPLLLIRLHPYIIKLLDKQTKCNLVPGIFILNHTQYIYIKVFHYLLWYDVMLQLTRQKWESETLALSAAQIISYQDFCRWAK